MHLPADRRWERLEASERGYSISHHLRSFAKGPESNMRTHVLNGNSPDRNSCCHRSRGLPRDRGSADNSVQSSEDELAGCECQREICFVKSPHRIMPKIDYSETLIELGDGAYDVLHSKTTSVRRK